MHPTRLAAVALALSLFSATLASAETITIQPSSSDAFILKNQPNRITGAKNLRLRVEASIAGTQVRRALVQFPLGAIPPGSTVTSAVIGLYASLNAANPALTNGVYRITEPWAEASVKWNNQPQFLSTPTATAVVGDGRGFKNFDVTADVQEAINICPTDNGWVVKDVAENGSNDSIAYNSKEEKHPSEIANQPKLVVTFTPPPCTSDADCQDTNLCTSNEVCTAGECKVTEVTCDDGNACTDDVCNCATGCSSTPLCNDGFACTTDVCDPTTLECTYTQNDDVCSTDCSTGSCLGDPDSTEIDPNSGCLVETTEPAGTPCNDGESCTTPDQCNGSGTCTPGPKDCGLPGCGTSPVCEEVCDNCIDDNEDGLVDRNDPSCAPVANGGGQGAGDPKFRGKPVIRCQKAIRAAGLTFAKQLRTRLQKCTDGVFLCLQQKPGDAACLAKAQQRCAKQTLALQGGPSTLDQRLAAKITKGCGPKKPGLLPVVPGSDLCGLTGLGFVGNVAACQTPQSAALLAGVTNTIATEHRCRTVELFAADVPRATELLRTGGVDLATLPCLLPGAEGGNLGLGKPTNVLKAVVACQRGLGTAGAKFVNQVLAAEQRCSEGIAQCIQTKPGNAKCLAKAQAVCRKLTTRLYVGPQSREAKLKTQIARTCGTIVPGKAPRVALGDLRSLLGLGYDSLQSTCAVLGVNGLTSLDDVSECLVRQHVCRADQLLTSQTPRAHELLAIGGAVSRP